MNSSGLFLESSETFGVHFGWHNSLCIFRTRAYEARNFAVIFIFIPFTTFVKTSFTELACRSFTNGLSGRKRFGTFEKGAPGLSFNYGVWKFSLFTFQHVTRYIFFCPFLSSTLRNEYFQKGGNDPAILAQMQGLEFEAQRLQANQRQPPPAGIVDMHNCIENYKSKFPLCHF